MLQEEQINVSEFGQAEAKWPRSEQFEHDKISSTISLIKSSNYRWASCDEGRLAVSLKSSGPVEKKRLRCTR